jgi:hypothetical protein
MSPWLGDDVLHKTHWSALLYKLRDYYEQYDWSKEILDPKVEYLWPMPVEGGKEGENEFCPPKYWKQRGTTTTKPVGQSKSRPKQRPLTYQRYKLKQKR